MYRYRDNAGSTNQSLKALKHLPKLGEITEIVAYCHQSRRKEYTVNAVEQVMVKGINGTARFSSFCWSYQGEGPRGLVQLLIKCGLNPEQAKQVAFTSPRTTVPGVDWRLVKKNGAWELCNRVGIAPLIYP